MSADLVVDTDIFVDYLRGQGAAAKWLEAQESDLLVSAITVAELFAGIRGERETAILNRFLLALVVVPATEEIARLAGRFRRDYGQSHGTGLADAFIAATAALHSARLATFNRRHFPMLDAVEPYTRPG